jgi:hypothetical protein
MVPTSKGARPFGFRAAYDDLADVYIILQRHHRQEGDNLDTGTDSHDGTAKSLPVTHSGGTVIKISSNASFLLSTAGSSSIL